MAAVVKKDKNGRYIKNSDRWKCDTCGKFIDSTNMIISRDRTTNMAIGNFCPGCEPDDDNYGYGLPRFYHVNSAGEICCPTDPDRQHTYSRF